MQLYPTEGKRILRSTRQESVEDTIKFRKQTTK